MGILKGFFYLVVFILIFYFAKDTENLNNSETLTFTITGQSMEPYLLEGDKIKVIRELPSVGDVGVFYNNVPNLQCNEPTITHRVIAENKTHKVTKGDNGIGEQLVRNEDFIGTVGEIIKKI